jgi:hypothetical protein
MPAKSVRKPATIRTNHIVMWMPGWLLGTDEKKWNVICSNCCDANQPAVYAPTA